MWNCNPGDHTRTYRPTASHGTVTNGTNAYDVDAYPWATSADRALVTGSTVPGTADFATLSFDTFPSVAKSGFSNCLLTFAISASLTAPLLASTEHGGAGSGLWDTSYNTASLQWAYQVDGATWVSSGYIGAGADFLQAFSVNANASASGVTFITHAQADGDASATITKQSYSVLIPSASFSSNLSDLKIEFILGTATNASDTTKKSSGLYSIWDIQARLT